MKWVLFLGAVAIVAWGFLRPPGAAPSADPPPSPSFTVAETPTAPAVEPTAAPERAVWAYLGAFLDQTLPYPQWRAQTLAHATGALSAALTTVDRTTVPVATVVRVHITGATAGYAEAIATLTDGLRLDVTVVRVDGTWRVDEVVPR